MEPDNKPPEDNAKATSPSETNDASAPPADALSRTPDELAESEAEAKAETEAAQGPATVKQPKQKKPSRIKRFLRRINVYFLFFLLIVAIAAVVMVVNYLNSQQAPAIPDIATQTLTEEALQELANTDSAISDTSQTLTIQGNTVIEGQTLMRGNLDVAGNLQTGGTIQGSGITISGSSNLGETQVNSLQVASDTAIQGTTSLGDLSVSGTTSFSGAVSASDLTVTNLTLSGNATLNIPNHIRFTGPTPSRTLNPGPLGNGGSISISGSDTSGTINLNSGNNTAPGCFGRITFNQPFSDQPRIIVSPIGAAAGQAAYYVTRDNAGFSICSANAVPANQAFAFDYFIAN